ncbi:tetratricopeptide repeat protein [Sphingobacteriaceae bacterium]|nr:tetratricopeptide repeat protein [Sphingobacteriaceae bacterium]
MADLKEETTVDNNETNPVEETVETKRPIDPNLQGIQLFYEKNKKMVTYVGGGLLLVIGVICFFKLYYIPEQEKEAVNEIFWAESLFAKDSFNVALKGGPQVMSADGQKPMKGFLQIADEYSITKTGSLANYYAGICYLRTGKFAEAVESLGKYSGNDETIAPIAIGAMGDAYMEMNNVDDAIKYYSKAADKSENIFTRPYFLKKAAFANEQKGNFSEATKIYERIQKEFPRSTEGQDIEKFITRAKAKDGK